MEEYVQDLNKQLRAVLLASQRHQHTVLQRISQPKPEDLTKFIEGQFILAQVQKPGKGHHKWKGPLVIVEISGNLIKAQNIITQQTNDYHISTIKPYISFRDFDVTQTAQKDLNEYVIESILDHQGSGHALRDLQFLVRWKDFPSEYDTWEPYKNLRDAAALEVYLSNHPQLKLPKRS